MRPWGRGSRSGSTPGSKGVVNECQRRAAVQRVFRGAPWGNRRRLPSIGRQGWRRAPARHSLVRGQSPHGLEPIEQVTAKKWGLTRIIVIEILTSGSPIEVEVKRR